jgi:hypothetical protein
MAAVAAVEALQAVNKNLTGALKKPIWFIYMYIYYNMCIYVYIHV